MSPDDTQRPGGDAGGSRTEADLPQEAAPVAPDGADRDNAEPDHADGQPADAPRERTKVRGLRLGLLVGVPFAVLLAIGLIGHLDKQAAADSTQKNMADAAPKVAVDIAKREDGPVKITLPAETQAFDVASIYPRATGYVAERRVDIGSRVRKGDLLIRISAPDEDAELEQAVATLGQLKAAEVQAQATLEQAVANQHLSSVTKKRTVTLAGEGWATRQNADNDVANNNVQTSDVKSAQAGIAVAAANTRAEEATIDRLQALVGFERVVAPFDGVITQRNVDVGDLLQADSSSGTSSTPLLSEVADDVLRCSVYVPQSQAVGITDGLAATVAVPEMPGRVFHATVSRNAASLDASLRSMLTQVDVDNRDHLLKPGLFVNITFSVPRPSPVVTIPDSAVIFDGKGLMVATVEDGRARMHPIVIEHDLGTVAELSSGLQGGEQVIVSPPADLVDGEKVTAPPPPNQPTAAPPPA